MLKMENRAQPNGFSSSETQRAWIENELEEEMKTQPPATWASLIFFVCACGVCAQGTFQNLDFEQANLHPSQSGTFVGVNVAVPGWALYYGTVPQTQLVYNEMAAGSTSAAIIDNNGVGIYQRIEGNYSLLLQGGLTATEASIRQSGVIPAGTVSLLFKARPAPGLLDVSLNGVGVPTFVLQSFGTYVLYGASINGLSGTVAELKLAARANVLGPNNWVIDAIEFSRMEIPEPSPLILISLGFLAVAYRVRFSQVR